MVYIEAHLIEVNWVTNTREVLIEVNWVTSMREVFYFRKSCTLP